MHSFSVQGRIQVHAEGADFRALTQAEEPILERPLLACRFFAPGVLHEVNIFDDSKEFLNFTATNMTGVVCGDVFGEMESRCGRRFQCVCRIAVMRPI